jgi:2-succinyl-5-enolpyruvyl-6-hydroxy-3-cyclohexene-1-carboxylate synthase
MNLNLAWARAIFEELGVREAVICPGSRSAPLAVAASQLAKTCTVLDERSAAFFALGAAKASRRPAAVVCTSGSAGAHFYPAILEAEAAGVPLVAITADRPPELHGFGAPQTLDQGRLFGQHVRFVELGVPEAQRFAHLRALVADARRSNGPLHLNAPFREPLAPVDEPMPALHDAPAAVRLSRRGVPELRQVAQELFERPRGIVFCGPGDCGDARELADALGYALLADAASGARGEDSVSHADLILRSASWARALEPQAVVRFGGGTSSKHVQAFLEGAEYQVVVRSVGEAIDPAQTAAVIIEADADAVCRELLLSLPPPPASGGRSPQRPIDGRGISQRSDNLWLAAERKARAALESALANAYLSEPLIAREAARTDGLLYVSSSMPVRDVDAFAGAPRARVLVNRGLNGIDGIVSCAAGAAWSNGEPATALVGDLALLHDLGGLIAAARLNIPLNVLCVNNDGGGIFHFLPIAAHKDVFEPLFGTPHGLDLEGAAKLVRAEFVKAGDARTLREALKAPPTLRLIEARTDRERNVEQHRALQAAVVAALGDPP